MSLEQKAHQPVKIHELENLFKLIPEKFIKDYKSGLRLVYWHDKTSTTILIEVYDNIINHIKQLINTSNDCDANFAFKKLIKALSERRLYAANQKV